MERNVHFDTAGLTNITARLAWAQLEVFADQVEKIQVMAAGDEGSVNDLRMVLQDGSLIVEQPQYGLSLNIMGSRWMQICIRIPLSWTKDIRLSTISGLLSAQNLRGDNIVLDSISGDLHATRITAEDISLKSISGDIRGEALTAERLSVRSVSGNLALSEIGAETLKGNSVSGEQTYRLHKAFQRIDVYAVSGDVSITSPVETMNVSMRSISGRIRTQNVSVVDADDVPKVQVTGVSAELELIAL